MAVERDTIRRARLAVNCSQLELARRAGISRQALGAIEAGLYQPSVAVALSLARALGETVEHLFGTGDEGNHVEVPWGERDSSGSIAAKVVLARVGGKVIAVAQPRVRLTLSPATGMLASVHRHRARIATFRTTDEIDSTLLIAGCDPAVTVLAEWLARRRPQTGAVGLSCSSRNALATLMEGRAHVAGVHVRDPRSDEYNVSMVRAAVGTRRAVIVNFARWELGFATAPGNPLEIRGGADLSRPGLSIANRESGAGARAFLDETMLGAGLKPGQVQGYKREFAGHLEVAAAIAMAQADLGVTIRLAADAYGLGFIPL
ncbi:MAG: substrate-binding domain-containing protein, partial [Candidatus Binataceae bacterium]